VWLPLTTLLLAAVLTLEAAEVKFWQRISTAAALLFRSPGYNFDRPLDGGGALAGPQMRRPFAESVYVMAAIQHIAKPIAAVPLEFYGAGESETPVNDPRLAKLWRRPARRVGSLAEFVLGSVGWRKLAGESFWLLDDRALVPFPEARGELPPLILARPDRMRHVEADGELAGWEFTDGRGRRHLLVPEQVIHLKQWNPYDDFRGLGNYEAARLAAETESANERFQLSLAQNNGDQGVYVVAKSGVPDDGQKTQIIAQLREKRALQQRGIFRPIFLGGDISVEDPKVRAVDAAFLEGSRLSAEKIYLAFGVPVSMASKTESYSIGSASDYFRLILDACQPEARELAAGISQVSGRLTGREVEAEFGWDAHPVLQAVRKESLDSLGKLCDRGMPVKSAGEYLDLGLPRFPGDNVGHLPFSVAPVGEERPPESDPALQEPPPAADPVQEALRALRLRRAAPAARQAGPVCARATAKEAAIWRAHIAKQREVRRAFERAFTRVLFAARSEVLRKLESRREAGAATTPRDARSAPETGSTPTSGQLSAFNGQAGGNSAAIEAGLTTRAGAVDFLFDLAKFKTGLQTAFRGVGQNGLQGFGKQLFAELGKDDPFTFPPAKAVQFLRSRENPLADVADDVWDRIRAVVEDGLNAGDSTDAIAGLVRGEFNELSQGRAATVASTETSILYGVARQEGMEQAGVQWKQWLTSGADNVRPEHRAANGQTVGTNDFFTVGGEQLAHPGDPHGSAGNIINCHCVCIAVAGPEGEA
jgi:phage portal protein BeeE